ncbi:MAG: transcriptional regulator [Candidatus Bathyarchaeia archaeon]|nr:transcriptional regulator [Candidatus Bathyarchaeota archaeon]
MSSEISLTPIGRESIHKLESALLAGTLLRPEVLSMLKESSERLTWVDSLAVAAAALAREKAKMSISQIAEELGRSEATIKNHLAGKTKAGQLVKETYEKFASKGVEIPSLSFIDEIESLKKQLEEERNRKLTLEKKLINIKEKLQLLLTEI